MIVTIIPFLLAANFESPDSLSWKRGTEVTYLIQSHATTLHSSDSDCFNMAFNLQAMLSCQPLNSSLYCHFHDVHVHSALADTKQPRPLPKYIMEDLWTKKVLQQDTVDIAYDGTGKATAWIPIEVDAIGRDMISALTRLLVVGLDLSNKQTGNFETPSNASFGFCKTKYFATRSAASSNGNENNSMMKLFLTERPNESLARPLEISQKVEDPECVDKFHWFSFFAARELRKVNPKDMHVELKSAENYIIMNQSNYTSFSKIRVSINNHRDNTKYILDESISLSLQKIRAAECPECSEDNSQSREDHSNEEKNIFFG